MPLEIDLWMDYVGSWCQHRDMAQESYQLGTQNLLKSFKNRCQDAFHLGLHFLIDF